MHVCTFTLCFFPPSQQTQAQWRTVFFICAGIYTFGTLFYLLFGSGELQPWARQDLSIEVAPPLLKKDDAMLESRPIKPKDGELFPSAGDSSNLMTSEIQ